MKTQILEALGETGLRQACAINAALAANDRIKYGFSLLQLAIDHANHPRQPVTSLKPERLAAGIDDTELDNVISGARSAGKHVHIPGAIRLLQRIENDVRLMAAPILTAPILTAPVLTSDDPNIAKRLETLLTTRPQAPDDIVDPDAIAAMTQATHGPDSLHRLVMDLHKRLNTRQAEMAQETLNGAAAYGLDQADHSLVIAFMAGLNRTSKLKFNHPGLATTATRASGRLIIQNDLGTTDAHVIVIHVQDHLITVTYTDIHPERLAFFQSLLKPRGFIWSPSRPAQLAQETPFDSPFCLATGERQAEDGAACEADLDFLAAHLVFLIDWNHARKQLRPFQHGPDRLALLTWAATEGIGHRGFLEQGGATLINRAIEATAGSAMHFGDRLCTVLGDAETSAFLQFAFRAATEGMLAGQSHALIQDRIRVALAGQFSNEAHHLMGRAAEHAALVFDLASLVRDGVQDDSGHRTRRVRHARRLEHDADQIVADTRDAVRRRPDHAAYLPLLEAADEAADALEDAVFLLDLHSLTGKALTALQNQADLLAEASQEWVKAVGHAGQIGKAQSPDTEDFLAAIDRIGTLEHAADDAQRLLTASAVAHAADFRQLHLFAAIGDKLESAADALKHAGLMLREQVLEHVVDA